MTRTLATSALALMVALASSYATPAQGGMTPAGVPPVSWTALAWQAQQVSRWQAERFGPIVSSDTMWTIATYYGRQQGVTVYVMMDAIVAANPRVFIDNRPDRMMDGYYLVIPTAGKVAVQPSSEKVQSTEFDKPREHIVDSSDTVQFKADELRDLRDRLAGSIEMIEQLQNENVALQSRLNDVTAELEALKLKLAEDRAIDQEIDAIAGELATQVPGVETSQQRVIDPVEPVDTALEQQPVQQDGQHQVVEQTETAVVQPVVTAKPAMLKKGVPNFIDWLLQPPQVYVVIAVPVLLLLIFLYLAYVRRIRQQFEPQSAPVDTAPEVAETDLDIELAADHDQADDHVASAAAAGHELSESEFEVASDDPLLGSDDDDDFAKLLASLEAPPAADNAMNSERQPPLAQRQSPWSDDSSSGLSLADEYAIVDSMESAPEEGIDDGDYVSIDTLLNDADDRGGDDDTLIAGDFDPSAFEPSAIDESKTPAAQLDLAQAYIDMGELDDARALLKKIVGCDDADADREAALLLQQLDSQSGR